MTSRKASAYGEPPGSRVRTTSRPAAERRRSRRRACTDLPAPSPPSRVMKRPRRLICEIAPARLRIAVAPRVRLPASKARRIRPPGATEPPVFSGASITSMPSRQTFKRPCVLALLDRRRERPAIDDLRDELVVLASRDEQHDRPVADKRNLARCSAVHRRRADRSRPPRTPFAGRRRGSRSRSACAPPRPAPSRSSRPYMTTIRRWPSSTAEPTRPNPPSAASAAFSPSAPRSIVSSGLRLSWRILFQVNSFSPK